LLILDEPTNNLDFDEQREIYRFFHYWLGAKI